MSVLSKGLSFAPTHSVTSFDTRVDLFRFYRSLHLKVWHAQNTRLTHSNLMPGDTTNNDTTDLPTSFKPKSRFSPIVPNPALITFSKKVDFEINRLMETHPVTHRSNLSRKGLLWMDFLRIMTLLFVQQTREALWWCSPRIDISRRLTAN